MWWALILHTAAAWEFITQENSSSFFFPRRQPKIYLDSSGSKETEPVTWGKAVQKHDSQEANYCVFELDTLGTGWIYFHVKFNTECKVSQGLTFWGQDRVWFLRPSPAALQPPPLSSRVMGATCVPLGSATRGSRRQEGRRGGWSLLTEPPTDFSSVGSLLLPLLDLGPRTSPSPLPSGLHLFQAPLMFQPFPLCKWNFVLMSEN